MGEIDAVLQRAGLGSFSDALAGYGLECINDLDQFNDGELQREFNMKPVQIKKLRIAAQDHSLGVPMPASAAAPAPPNAPPPPPPPPPPTAAAPTSLQAFMENNGLGQFFTAFEMFGVSGLEDFAEGTHFDDETCRDIGMSPEHITAFRNALRDRAPPQPQPPAEAPKTKPSQGAAASSSGATGSGGGGSSKARGKSPGRSANKYYRSSPAQEPNDVDDLPQEANSHTVPFPTPPPPPPPPSQVSTQPQEASQPWQPSAAPAPMPPPPPPQAPQAPPPTDPRLLALPVAERSKVAVQVDAALAGVEVSPDVLAKPDAPSKAAKGGWASSLGAALPPGNKAPELAMDGGLALQRAADKCLEELGACDAERLKRLPFDDARLLSYEPSLAQLWNAFVTKPMQAAAVSTPYLEAKKALVATRVESSRQRSQLDALQATIKAQREAGDLDSALVSQQRLVGSFEQMAKLAESGHAASARLRATLYNLARALASTGPGDPPPEAEVEPVAESAAPAAAATTSGGFGGLVKAAQSAAATSSSKQAAHDASEAKRTSATAQQAQLAHFQQRLHQSASELREMLLHGVARCERDMALLTARQEEASREVAEGPSKDVDVEEGENKDDDDGSGLSWASKASAAETARVSTAQEAEKARCSEAVALLEGQRTSVEAGIATGDKVAYLEAQASQLRGLARHLEAEVTALNARRQQAVQEAAAADRRRVALVQARETRKVATLLVVDALKTRLAQLQATKEAYEAAAALLEAMVGRAGWLGEVVGARLTTLDGVVTGVEAECLSDHLAVAGEHLSWAQVLYSRKTRDLDHLAARLLQHAQERRDAIERDNADDVHRADRDKEETLAAQTRARDSVDTVMARKTRALDGLVGCLGRAAQRPLPPRLMTAAQEALKLAQQEVSLPEHQATLEAITFSGNGESDADSGVPSSDAATLEARFLISPSVVEAELMRDVPGCLAPGGLPPDPVAEAAAAAAAQAAARAEAQAQAEAARRAAAEAEAARAAQAEAARQQAAQESAAAAARARAEQEARQEAANEQARQREAQLQQAAAERAAQDAAAQQAAAAAAAASAPPPMMMTGEAPPPPPPPAAAGAASEETEMVHVQMVVPADAAVGGYLQASVSREGKEFHFSVVVPEGAVPGVTTLTVPVPIPKTPSQQDGAAANPIAAMPPGMVAPPPPPPPPPSMPPSSSGSEPKGMDVVASYFMDHGVDAGAAIEAAMKCTDAGLDTAALLRDADPAFLKQISNLSDAQVLGILSHRDHAEVSRALGGGGSSGYGGGSGGYGNTGSGESHGMRRYSIDQLDDDDDEPLTRGRS